jgi:hypothetical protein
MLRNPTADADTEMGAADELASELCATGALADSRAVADTGAVADSGLAQPLTSHAATQTSTQSDLRTLAPPERLTPQDDVRLHAGQQGDEPQGDGYGPRIISSRSARRIIAAVADGTLRRAFQVRAGSLPSVVAAIRSLI